jgi:hypothetical protein
MNLYPKQLNMLSLNVYKIIKIFVYCFGFAQLFEVEVNVNKYISINYLI